MFGFNISEEQKREMEKVFWSWLAGKNKRRMNEIKKIFLDNPDFCNAYAINPASTESIKKFFLFSAENLKNYLAVVSITESAKNYLLARYNDFRREKAGEIVHILGGATCPYCNQSELPIIIKNGKYEFKGELDHFYEKSAYPHLVLCLYNLIPCCRICNHERSNASRLIQNPYQKNYAPTSIVFQTNFDDACDISYLFGSSTSFEISFMDEQNISDFDKAENEMFKIQERYACLQKDAKEIIFKSRAYNSLYNEFLESLGAVSEEDIKQYLFGYRSEHIKRALSKFHYDIMNEFLS